MDEPPIVVQRTKTGRYKGKRYSRGNRYKRHVGQAILDFLQTEESNRYSRIEIAKRFHTTPNYVSQVAVKYGKGNTRIDLRRIKREKKDELDGVRIDLTKERGPADLPRGIDRLRKSETAKVQRIVEDGTLDVDEQRRQLSFLAQHALRDEAKVAAHRALQQLDQATGVQTRLGPGEPLTWEDRAFRLSLLIQACGKEVTNRAYEMVFGTRMEETKEEPTHDAIPVVLDGVLPGSDGLDPVGEEEAEATPAQDPVLDPERDNPTEDRGAEAGETNGAAVEELALVPRNDASL